MFTLLALLVAPRADDVLPVPILELSEGDFVVGGYAGFGVFGADPFTRVWLALTLDGVGSGPCGPNGLCLGVVHPTAFLWGSSGLTSIRIWDLGVPAWVAGHTVCAQAVARVRGAWTASNVECRDVTVAGDPIAWGAGEYLVTQNVLPRADADRVCAAVGMSVALPDDPAEAAFLTDALAAS
ncbi:MAG TPA: hypothetical protein PKA64_06190, partial [Myxococcota bacterium]|nr:hypothetical protein [Myxococcota bacterium]